MSFKKRNDYPSSAISKRRMLTRYQERLQLNNEEEEETTPENENELETTTSTDHESESGSDEDTFLSTIKSSISKNGLSFENINLLLKELERTEPNIINILNLDINISDKLELMQYYEIYTQLPISQEKMELKNRINGLISQCLERYKYLSEYELLKSEINISEPSIEKILSANLLRDDKIQLLLLYDIYVNESIPHLTEHGLEIRTRINTLLERYKKEYVNYIQYSKDQHSKIDNVISNISSGNTHTSLKFKIMNLETSDFNKAIIFNKYTEMIELSKTSSEEYMKVKTWVEWAVSLPYDKLKILNISTDISSFLKSVKKKLDDELYGMDKVKEQVLLFLHSRLINPNMKSSLALIGPPGVGKCLGKNTPVLLYNGKIELVQNIIIGDVLMGDDSSPRIVTSLARGREQMYRIKQSYGDSYIVNESHILSLWDKSSGKIVDMSLVDYLSSDNTTELFGIKVPVELNIYKKVVMPDLDPYVMGRLYGADVDGCINMSRQFFGNKVKFEHVKSTIHRILDFNKHLPEENRYHILPCYKYNTIYNRLRFIIGFLDSCATQMSLGYFKFIVKTKSLHDDLMFMIRSVGIKVESLYFSRINIDYQRYITDAYICSISSSSGINNITIKKNNDILGYNLDRYINNIKITVEKLDIDEYYGFTIDDNNRFLLGDFTVTHNTKISRLLADVLDYPFEQISIGDIGYIKGHDHVYIGSRPGIIIESLKRMKCKNGILFFDEYEKLCSNNDIKSILLQITDPTQNHDFRDNYLNELTIDLSHLWFIYSMNELPEDKALQDRLYVIRIDGYNQKDKISIVQNYLLPKMLKMLNFDATDVIISDDVCRHLINKVSSEDDRGIRVLERSVNELCSKLCFIMTTQDDGIPLSFNLDKRIEFPINVTREMVDKMICNVVDVNSSKMIKTMYI